jgi:hypothetical protein
MFRQKSILFIAPDEVVFPSVFEKNLKSLGFAVYMVVPLDAKSFRYKNIGQRLYNFWRKTVLGDKGFKRKLILKQRKEQLLDSLNTLENMDYGLVIRPDLYPIEFIELANRKCKTFIGYQWDGLDRYPEIQQYMPLMDRFFVFDTNDLSVGGMLPTTNFYFDYMTPSFPNNHSTVYYLGSYLEERIDILSDINAKLETLHVNKNIKIVSDRKRVVELVASKGLTPTSEVISYEENLQNVFKSNVLIDIQNPVHKGLSFRIFEGIGYDKKVITTNADVVNYDFYQPENFLVWDGQDVQELAKFIATPYRPLDEVIKQKYGFSNWIAYVLDKNPYTPVDLPS